jgi:chromosome segregation ATPase
MLDEKYGFALSGMSHLKKISTDKREEELSKAPWLPKSVLVTSDTFKSIVENPSKLPGIIKDSPIIITNIDHFNSDKKQITVGDVFIPHREYQKYIEKFDVNKTKQILINKLAKLEEKARKHQHTFQKMKEHEHKVNKFVQQYLENKEQDYESELTLQLTNKQSQKKSSDLKLSNIQAEIRVIDEEIKQKISDLSDLQDKLDSLKHKLIIIQNMHDLEKTCGDTKERLKSCKLESEKLEHQLSIIEGKFTNQKIAYAEKSSIVNQITNELNKIERVLNHIGQYNDIRINIPSVKLEELENNELCTKFKALDKVIRKTDINVVEKEGSIRTKQIDIKRYKKEIIEQHSILWEDIELKNPQQHCPDENKKQLKDQINSLKKDIDGLNVKCNNATAKQMASDISFNEKIDAYCLKSNEKYVRTPSLQDASVFEDVLINLKNEFLNISSKIEDLTKDCQNKNSALSSYNREYDLYEQLEHEYQLTNYNVEISDKLKTFTHASKDLSESKKQIQKLGDDFNEAVKDFISKTTDLEVDIDYVTNIWVKFPVAHNLSEAHNTASNLDEYSERVSTDMAIIKEELDSVQSDENILIDRVLRFTKIYKEHLKDFPSMSKIKVNENKYENLVRIDFDRHEYPEEQARDIIKKYIQDLLNDDKIDEKKLINRITPRELIGKVIDLDSIRVQIRKLDKKPPYKFQDWEKINASTGQENAMYIIFLASLLSYIREIVVNRNDIVASKILIVDNPFGSTGAGYLWERIWSIMERNKIQLICPGHNIDPTVRSFFPVSYLLTEDMSTNGRTRVVVKESNMNGKSIERAIQLRNGQMTLGHEFIN